MPMQFSYTPPALNGVAVVAAAKEAAEEAGALALLALSQPNVPVDKGALVASGHVERDGIGAAVVYSATNPKDGYDYAARQHEELSFHHEHGEAKYLEKSMHSGHVPITEAMAAIMRRVI